MTPVDLGLRLEGGYAALLGRTRLQLQFSKGPFRQGLELSPFRLFRRRVPIEMTFQTRSALRGTLAPGLRWRVAPEGGIRARLLFEGNAYIGNFRVPAGHYAIQWSVDGEVESSLAAPQNLLEAGLRTRLNHLWVEVFPAEESLVSALQAAWNGFRNPLDPGQAFQLREHQLVLWRWTGRVHLSASLEWGISSGWAVPLKAGPIEAGSALVAGAGSRTDFRMTHEGAFELRLVRRGQKLELTVHRRRGRKVESGWTVGLWSAQPLSVHRLRFADPGLFQGLVDDLSRPALRRIDRTLEQALIRRMEISLALESSRWRENKLMLKARWASGEETEFRTEYARLLKGQLPVRRTGLEVSGAWSAVERKTLEISLNLFDWLRLGNRSERRRTVSVSLGPSGELLIERGTALDKTRYRWDEIQFLALVHRSVEGPHRVEETLGWSFGREESFGYHSLRELLRLALSVRALSEFDLPAPSDFPRRIRFLWVTRFDAKGIDEVRRKSDAEQWNALVDALKRAEPDRYAAPAFWNDWIHSAAVRETVRRHPAQAHLVSLYPVPGRSEFERRQVVNAYQKAARFLRLLSEWREGRTESIFDSLQVGLDVPVFLYFHLLCPAQYRRSTVILTGDLERTWGEPQD